MKKIIFIFLVILLIAGGILLIKKRKDAMANASQAVPITYTVRTVEPQTQTVVQTGNFLAQLEPTTRATLSTKLSGQLTKMAVSESQIVQKGDLLLQIDDREIQSNLTTLQANLSAARQQLQYAQNLQQRNQAMFDAGGLPQEKLEASAVALNNADAAVQGLEQQILAQKVQLEYTRIVAPFDGTVGTLFLREGDLAAPGKPILTLNSKTQKLTFSFAPESGGVEVGQNVLWQDKKLGTLSKLYADAQGGLTVAEVIPDGHIAQPAGSYLSVQVVTRSPSGCAIPLQALLHRPNQTSVMLHTPDGFKETAVTVLAQDATLALVEPDLQQPVAVAAEAKLALLPAARGIQVIEGDCNE
jgi:multidrug efflux pump subunit AcrA (membrane-fusion protein)